MTKKICFVIRPFDKEYDNRFDIVYRRAIKHAGLIPRHAGEADAEEVPADVKKCIREAHICLVDITEDRPNVWYELGLADDQNKPIVIVSNTDFRDKNGLPSDISGKFVIFYNSEVDADVSYRNSIIEDITKRIKARAEKIDSNGTNSYVARKQAKNADNEILRNKRFARPIVTRQSQNFGNFTPFDGKVLKVIYTHHSTRLNSPIVRGDIVSNFPGEEREVLDSIDRMELDRYIEKVPSLLSENGLSGYRLTKKGRQWYHYNNHSQLINPFHTFG